MELPDLAGVLGRLADGKIVARTEVIGFERAPDDLGHIRALPAQDSPPQD
ncbi:hypothetical protein [Rhodococcus koreensis]